MSANTVDTHWNNPIVQSHDSTDFQSLLSQSQSQANQYELHQASLQTFGTGLPMQEYNQHKITIVKQQLNSNFVRFNNNQHIAQDRRKKIQAEIERQKQKMQMIARARERDLAAIKRKLLSYTQTPGIDLETFQYPQYSRTSSIRKSYSQCDLISK